MAAGESRNRSYLEGRKVVEFSAIPRKTEPRFSGSNTQSSYGGGPKITRLDGRGNGGNVLHLTPETEDAILLNNEVLNPTYQNGAGPVKITVIDPLKVPNGSFELTMIERPGVSGQHEGLIADSTTWVLTRILDDGTELSVSSDTSINYKNEQVILASTVVEGNISTTDINII